MSLLNKLVKTTTRSKKRVGRGYGSGKGGHTTGRGTKGRLSRGKVPVWFEGGQLPSTKKYPMIRGKGKFSPLRVAAEITLDDLERLPTQKVTLDTLKLHKVIEKSFKKAKIIKTGTLTKKRTVEGIAVSAQAREAIEKLGGSVE